MLTLEQANDCSDADIKILTNGLNANAQKKRGMPPVDVFAFFLKDACQNIAGGCNGFMYYGCLYIDQLWIDEKYRGQGYGTKLITAAENWAIIKDCLFSTLETMDWEALDFYKNLGYYLESEQRGYLNNSVMYRLRKDW